MRRILSSKSIGLCISKSLHEVIVNGQKALDIKNLNIRDFIEHGSIFQYLTMERTVRWDGMRYHVHYLGFFFSLKILSTTVLCSISSLFH